MFLAFRRHYRGAAGKSRNWKDLSSNLEGGNYNFEKILINRGHAFYNLLRTLKGIGVKGPIYGMHMEGHAIRDTMVNCGF